VTAARDLELLNFGASTTREYTSYSASFRPEQNLTQYLTNLSKIISTKPPHWRVDEAKKRVIGSFSESNTVDTYLDAAHRVAFRHSALGNPLILHNSSSLNTSVESVGQFLGDRYNTGSTFVIAAGGLNHDEVVAAVEAGLAKFPSGSSATSPSSSYVGGESTFAGAGPAHVILAFEGVNLGSKDYLAAQLLQVLLGSGEKASSTELGNTNSVLNRNVVAKHPFARYTRAFNLSYTDSGLFGVYAVGDVDAADSIAKVPLLSSHPSFLYR
jgi:processing peptidase subunit beta